MGTERGSRSPDASLGLLDAAMVGIGAMIGAGIFVLTDLAADIAGPAALLVFALERARTPEDNPDDIYQLRTVSSTLHTRVTVHAADCGTDRPGTPEE